MLATLTNVGSDATTYTKVGDALAAHGLDWDVETRPTSYQLDNGDFASTGSFVTVRKDTEAVLGRVGGDYKPMNNVEALKHVDYLLDSGFATLDSVFALKGGRRVGASLRLNEQITVGDEDLIDMYIVVSTSHDGLRSDRTLITPIRMFCLNQLALVSSTARQSWAVRHLSTMEENLKVVGEELQIVTDYAAWLKRTGEKMISKTLSEIEMKNAIEQCLAFVLEESRKEKMTGEIFDVYKTSDLIGDQYRGTAWGTFNAVTEYFDHHRKYRTAEARYQSITDGVGARARNQMAQILLAA